MVKGEYSTWVFNTEDRDRMLADGWSVSGADPISAAAREEQVIAAVEQQWKNDEFGNDSGRIIDTIQAVYGSDRKTAEGLYRKHRERFPIRDQGVLQRPESRFSEFANYAGIDLQRQGPELNFGRRVGAQAAEVYGLGQGLGERLASVNPSGPQFQTQGFGSYLNTRGGNLADSYAEARSLLQRLDAAGAVGRSESELGFGRRVSEKDATKFLYEGISQERQRQLYGLGTRGQIGREGSEFLLRRLPGERDAFDAARLGGTATDLSFFDYIKRKYRLNFDPIAQPIP